MVVREADDAVCIGVRNCEALETTDMAKSIATSTRLTCQWEKYNGLDIVLTHRLQTGQPQECVGMSPHITIVTHSIEQVHSPHSFSYY
jgi:hypothetical protein